MTTFRKHLSAPGLLSIIHKQFSKIPDPREFTKNVTISIKDHLMSGLAIFGLKCLSLLDYDRKRFDNVVAKNLCNLYHVTTRLPILINGSVWMLFPLTIFGLLLKRSLPFFRERKRT